jgi:hypothetical protein
MTGGLWPPERAYMSVFAISFRIEYDDTYNERYESVVETIKTAKKSTYWCEPTSFFLIDYDGTSSELTSQIDRYSKFAPSKDLLIAINLSAKGFSVIGKTTDRDLQKLMDMR